MDINRTLSVAAAGMSAQNARLRIVAENIANANSLAPNPQAEPYRRRTIALENGRDRAAGTDLVRVARIGTDNADFTLRHEPGHPAADERGYVRVPNVSMLVEVMDMREAQRSYGANLAVFDSARAMATRLLDLLR